MKRKMIKSFMGLVCLTGLPVLVSAQSPTDEFHGLQKVLNNLYDQMIPLCSQLIGVAQGIAGFAAAWYIAVRLWHHITNAEPIDFYPLLRPFVIGFCIVIFPLVLSLINGILAPTVTATDAIVQNTNQAMYAVLDAQKNQLSNPQPGDPTKADDDPMKWYQYTHPDGPAGPTVSTNPIGEAFASFSISYLIRKVVGWVLDLLFKTAVLCIDVIRTFKLIVLAILGPLVFGLSIFDGFQHTLKHWLARYVNVYMWLPVANIFGAIIAKIQLNMAQLQASGGSTDPFFEDTNTAYLIFLLIAIVGYFSVPSIAGYIISVGGHALFSRTASIASTAVSAYAGTVVRETSAMISSFRKTQTSDSGSGSPSGSQPADFKTKKITGET